jgi:uncharacterized repeat protein (TIGR03803 family)
MLYFSADFGREQRFLPRLFAWKREVNVQLPGPCSKAKAAFIMCAICAFFLAAPIFAPSAQAKTKFKVLHTFHGRDGGAPLGVLVIDAAGNLYGTTGAGGSTQCGFENGCGTVFKMNGAGKELWLHVFTGHDGREPWAGLLRNATGNLFGTTQLGGDLNCEVDSEGCGAVFELNKTGKKEKVLHEFTGSDGVFPESLLVEDTAGNLYGTTYVGGEYGLGTVFRVDSSGHESVLYNFTGGSDGCYPYPGVILDSAGNLFGVTDEGGDGFCNDGVGVVFEVDTAGNETVLHTFEGGDGANPGSVLIFDSQGNLYGTTGYGGEGSGCEDESGCGTVFKLSPQSGATWSLSVLYSFCSLSNCADGAEPEYGPLVRDAGGNLYGNTAFGGVYQNCDGDACGVVFKLDTAGHETVLHSFTGGTDGETPIGGLVVDSHGNLYGTTPSGGAVCYSNYTCGVVFKVTP